MRGLLVLLAKVAVGFVAITCFVWLFFTVARADVNSSWLSTAAPGLQKTIDLPANQPPTLTNRDCASLNYVTVDGNATTGCFVQTGQGLLKINDNLLLPNNSSLGVPVTTYINNSSIIPIPDSDTIMTDTPAPFIGSYLHLYNDLSKDLTPNYSGIGPLRHLTSYAINKPADQDIRDKNGKLLAFNIIGTLAFSSNGEWAVVDSPGRGYMRINLETFEITPFASSLNFSNDTSDRRGETAISDDGRYVAIASDQYDYSEIYDMSTCSGTTSNDYSKLLNCQSRDYWPALSSGISGFHAIYSLRFTNEDNLAVTVTYNWLSGASYSAATFRLTAPGKAAHGIDYLALGDSYISGQGEFVYKDGTDTATNNCHLSPLSYPYTIGADLFNSYQSIACSGAVTNDVISSSEDYKGQVKDGIKRRNRNATSIESNFSPGYIAQLEFVTQYQPSIITLSVGGDDMGFSKIVEACVVPRLLPPSSTCYSTYDERMQVIKAIDSVFAKLQQTYTQIEQADPGVKLYVIGYPQVAVQGDCADNVRLSSSEINFSQQLISYLDWTIQQAAASTGALYIDTQAALDGHRLCETNSKDVAINGLTAGNDSGALGVKVIGSESYHPDVLGHELLGQWILRQTNNFSQTMPAPNASIVAPTPDDPLAKDLLYNLTNSGTVQPQVVNDDEGIAPDMMLKNVTAVINISGKSNGLQPQSQYQATIQYGTSTASIGSFTSDSNGDISGQLLIPDTTPTGFQTLHITGQNLAGQSIDIYKIIYIAASTDDYDGDGVSDADDQCLILPLSGKDADSDGIDDACDPMIGDAPTYQYPVTAKLTGNTIYIVNP